MKLDTVSTSSNTYLLVGTILRSIQELIVVSHCVEPLATMDITVNHGILMAVSLLNEVIELLSILLILPVQLEVTKLSLAIVHVSRSLEATTNNLHSLCKRGLGLWRHNPLNQSGAEFHLTLGVPRRFKIPAIDILTVGTWNVRVGLVDSHIVSLGRVSH